jgi:hypothetical protein
VWSRSWRRRLVNNRYRHGDLLIVQVGALPEGAVAVEIEGGVVLALGEATGHAHRIRQRAGSRVSLWEVAGQRYVQVEGEPNGLSHEEHRTVVLDPGVYRIIRQREYTGEDEVRYVAD